MKRDTLRGELVSEFFGTFVLILFGVGNVAQVVLAGGLGTNKGDYETITWAWGIAVIMGVYVAGGLSGAHINPAVTLAFAVRREFPWSKVVPYWIAQVVGAFVAALVVFVVYLNAFNAVDPGRTVAKTAGIFSTYPGPWLGTQLGALVPGLIDQMVGTGILVFGILAIIDQRNNGAGKLAPLMIGLLVVVIGMTFGLNHGYAINPARDFGPRLFTFFAGWGSGVWNGGEFIVPIIGPLVGGVLGMFAYDLGLGRFLRAKAEAAEPPPVGRRPEDPDLEAQL